MFCKVEVRNLPVDIAEDTKYTNTNGLEGCTYSFFDQHASILLLFGATAGTVSDMGAARALVFIFTL
nr:hypothetical protein Iba_chr13aCG7400 [Ipomoea batatas]